MKNHLSYILIIMMVFIMEYSYSFAGMITPDLETALTSAGPGEELSVIVTFQDRVDLKVFKEGDKNLQRSKIIAALKLKAKESQKDIKPFLENWGIKGEVSLWIINGLALRASAEVIRGLSELPGVENVRLDTALTAPQMTSGTAAIPGISTPEWNINTIGAPELWAMGYTGNGTVVAIMDTGVDAAHQDLGGKWRGGANSWFDPNGEHSAPYDATGHGTQVMGLLVGGNNGGTSIGVAPGAEWIAVKIFSDAGTASLSTIHQGFQWLLDPDGDLYTNDAPDVVNNSWGFEQYPNVCYPEFQPDVQALRAGGIEVTFSGGNTGPYASSSVSPANYPESFAVGAVDGSLTIADFSGRGPSVCGGGIYPAIAAPGVNVLTADLTFGGSFPGSYISVTGTSFAVPHVSGAMALLLGAFPCATVDDVESSLKSSAYDLGVPGADNAYGYGLLDSVGAYNVLTAAGIPAGTDADNDGYFIEGGSCGAVDCNDSDPLIHPGAREIKHDGADQDCNGYDLTIDIIKAGYSVSLDQLNIEATSSLGINARLELAGYGPMKWNRKKGTWTMTVAPAGGDPGTVTISGIEGYESAPTTSDGGGNTGGSEGNGKTCSDGVDNDKDGLTDCGDPDCSGSRSCK